FQLQLQRTEVSLDERLAPGHEHVAAAVVAELPAERDVDVDRHGTSDRGDARRARLVLSEARVPVIRRWIARVAGNGNAPVSLEEPMVDPDRDCPLDLVRGCLH